jgi:uncharacterized tellurite resistance protein B-like protein
MASDPPRLRMPRRKAEPDWIRIEREQLLERQIRKQPSIQRWFDVMHGGMGHVLLAQKRRQLAASLRITPGVSPYLSEVLGAVRQLLRIEGRVELYVEPSPTLNAFCMPLPEGALLVVVTSGAVERFSKHELLFLMGHELGHGLLGHYQLPASAMLQPMDEDTRLPWKVCVDLLAWSRCAEISADRFGLTCCQDPQIATRTFLKLASGLPEAYLGAGDDFDGQMDEWIKEKVAGEGLDHTHPLLPIRVACARSFADSEFFSELFGEEGSPPKYSMDEADAEAHSQLAQMDADPTHIETLDYPEDIMHFLAASGFLLIAADNDVTAMEYHWLSELVGHELAESVRGFAAEVGLEGLCNEIHARGEAIAAQMNRQESFALLEDIAKIVAVDGQVHPNEARGIEVVAKALQLPSSLADVAIRNVRGSGGDVQTFA